ncbi:type I restriction-modification system subunit M [Geitlerinema splendidum]|nr:type I restriction-modification system subunit M [Geitlerinema splendidum]
MAIKKSELYSSLWASCDELRGGMDASQYKDYVLVLLFVKYVSDKYAGQKYGDIEVPDGASFKDMVALKGKSDIGDRINKQIIAPLAKANNLPEADFPDFNDANKLGSGKEMVDRLTNLIAIFEDEALDFSKNTAGGDDLLGDAYEFLMRHFATESGKSKGQFYTPAEVSRVMAQVIGIRTAGTTASTAVYDPTCGSGSLLLKVADEAPTRVSLYGQEKDVATAGLARMNMILHNHATAEIKGGSSTLADPYFKEGDTLKTFDYVVANPPFSDKRWTTGFTPANDEYNRFSFGIPPAKQGDFAYLLHIIASLKSTGKGACILPHGVLFRGNAEAVIRKNLIERGYIKGIIGLPANLFYGTGIPACIVIIDKAGSTDRKGIFMIDASKGFAKDGPKNRLRDQDIHRIVDVFTRQAEVPKFSRFVKIEEIEKNDYNLNLPRYIDSSTPEDLQDLDAHLNGGIPEVDIDALEAYWKVCPGLRTSLFKPLRPGYVELQVEQSEIRQTILDHPEFQSFVADVQSHFDHWREDSAKELKSLGKEMLPKEEIVKLSESLLNHFHGLDLIDPYAVYQHLMDYWASTMQDDCYVIAAEGWKAEVDLVLNKKGKARGWTCDLIPKELVLARYFQAEQTHINEHEIELAAISAELEEMEEEQSGEEGVFSDLDKVSLSSVKAHLKAMAKEPEGLMPEEVELLKRYLELAGQEQAVKQWLKAAKAELDQKLLAKYKALTEDEVKELVVDDKWLAAIGKAVTGEVDRHSKVLTNRVRQLAERYETTLPSIQIELNNLSDAIAEHIKRMGVNI